MHRESLRLFLQIVSLGCALSISVSAQEKPQNWQSLLGQAKESFNNLNSAEAVSYLDKAIKALPQNGDNLAAQIEIHELRSAAHELGNKADLALLDSEKALEFIQQRDEGKANQEWVRPMLRVANLLDKTRQRPRAATMYLKALALSDQLKSNRLTISLEILYLCAKTQGKSNQWKEASKTLFTYIGRLEEKKGKDHADLVGPLKDLARYQRNAKDYAGAIDSLDRWVQIYEVAKGKDSPSTATGLRAIAECHIALGAFEAAEKACDRWQMVLERVTKKHPEIVYVLQLRAQIDRLQGKFAEESAHLTASSARMAALPKPDYTAIGEFHRLLSVSYRRQKKVELAKESIDICIKHFKKKLRPTDPQRLMGRLERGRVALDLGAHEAAQKDFDAVLRSWRSMAGDNHRVLLGPLEALLLLANKVGEKERAVELSTWIAKIKENQ